MAEKDPEERRRTPNCCWWQYKKRMEKKEKKAERQKFKARGREVVGLTQEGYLIAPNVQEDKRYHRVYRVGMNFDLLSARFKVVKH